MDVASVMRSGGLVSDSMVLRLVLEVRPCYHHPEKEEEKKRKKIDLVGSSF